MKIVIIGAGSVGFELARTISRREHDVVLVERDRDRLLDFAREVSPATLTGGAPEALVDEAEDKLGGVDVLINNAGVMMCPLGRTKEGLDTQLGTNHLGHFVLTARLIGNVLAGAPARIVNLSSGGHRMSRLPLPVVAACRGADGPARGSGQQHPLRSPRPAGARRRDDLLAGRQLGLHPPVAQHGPTAPARRVDPCRAQAMMSGRRALSRRAIRSLSASFCFFSRCSSR